MDSFPKLHAQANHAGAEFLFIELDTGSTFLDVAETTHVEENRVRNLENAHKAYETAVRYKDRIILDKARQLDFDQRLAKLKDRLRELGVPV